MQRRQHILAWWSRGRHLISCAVVRTGLCFDTSAAMQSSTCYPLSSEANAQLQSSTVERSRTRDASSMRESRG
eukprot:5562544-Pyramimonas_sp.AAC.1